MNVDVLADLEDEMRFALGHLPPGAALGQHRQAGVDVHRRDVHAALHRHMRRAALQFHRALQRRARALGEDDQVVARRQRARAILHQLRTAAVADEACGLDRPARERVAQQRCLHDAVGTRNERDKEHHVDQRRMVGQDQQARAIEPLQMTHFVRDHAHPIHQPHEPAETVVDDGLRRVLAPLGIARDQQQ
ncbi:hypothetical protein SDC9_137310 [bioreactor metagenome]|uniref:Uncharacterized protein n=1 Tax=bioreactor metagenome TaxID=1076179 RepID=A0A645DN16_9ZZZZ